MNKALSEVSKDSTQVYRTKEEVQRAFRPRYDPVLGKSPDATKDIESLLSSKASIAKQEHNVSVGIAKTMATDHVSSLKQEISFLNSQLGDTESRDVAIKKLQSSIANTSGIAAGLSGDAAQAYDGLYIPTARDMTTSAITKWEDEQKRLDGNVLKTEFNTFMDNTYSELDPDQQSLFLEAWSTRFSSVAGVDRADVHNAGVAKIKESFMAKVKSNPEGDVFTMANESFKNYAKVEEDGTITFKTTNLVAQKAISDAVYASTQPRLKEEAANKLKEMQRSYQDSLTKTTASMKAFNNELKDYVSKYGGDMEDDLPEAIEKYEKFKKELIEKHEMNGTDESMDSAIYDKVVGLESKGKYDVWYGNTKKYDGVHSAFGKYQFTKDTAKRMWLKAGIRGKMVHGKQTPAQQDRMWKAQVDEVKSALGRLEQPVTAGNFYIVHQMGEEGARRYFSGTLNTSDIENMNVNTGSKYKLAALHRAEIIQAWRNKHLSGEMTTAQAIASKSILDIASGEVDYREHRGDIKDAEQDLETAKSLQAQVNIGRKSGEMSAKTSEKIEDKIDKLIDNSDLAPRERQQFYTEQNAKSKSIDDYIAAGEEEVVVDKLHARATIIQQEQPEIQYADAFSQAKTEENLEPDHGFTFYTNKLKSLKVAQDNTMAKMSADTAEFHKVFVSSPLLELENPKTVTAAKIAALEPYYKKSMSAIEKVRYMKAANAYLSTQNYIKERYASTKYTGEIPEANTIDPLTGIRISTDTRKDLLNYKAGQFGDAVVSVFKDKTATEKEKLAMAHALADGSEGIDQETLHKFASKVASTMIQSGHGFNSEYGKYPELFAQPRFRVAVVNSLKNAEEKATWFAFEGFAKQKVIEENQKARMQTAENKKDPNNKNPTVKPDYSNIARGDQDADTLALLQHAGVGYIPEKSLKAMSENGIEVGPYKDLLDSDEWRKMPPTDREILRRTAAKLTRAGLASRIPMIASNMKANYEEVASKIKGTPTQRIKTFFERNPRSKRQPYFMVSTLLSENTDAKISPVQAKELIDDDKITIIEDGPLDTMRLVWDNGQEMVTVSFSDDMEKPGVFKNAPMPMWYVD